MRGLGSTTTSSKGNSGGAFAFLAEHHRAEGPQRADLAVEVEHLRLEKRRHVLGGHGRLGWGSLSQGTVYQRKVCCAVRRRYGSATMRIEVEILNELGLHARPAAEFVRAVQTFRCEVTILKDGSCYSAASILEVLSANLDCGSRLEIEAIGPDAEKALERLAGLLVEFRAQEERERQAN